MKIKQLICGSAIASMAVFGAAEAGVKGARRDRLTEHVAGGHAHVE